MTERDSKGLFVQFLASLGAQPGGELDLEETAEQVTGWLSRYFGSRAQPAITLMPYAFDTPVAIRSLPFYSLCQHHLVPFFGTMDIAYLPSGQVAGFGGIQRCIAHFSDRPQIQERLTEQVADYLYERIGPRGLLVVCRARQMCLELAGRSAGAEILTLASRGQRMEREYGELLQPGR
ncbi:MAG: GTP cyclohydrolase I [Bradymonadales bacterium]|nr:GTP cyclohydrolase I [Bradymonadales bacterium]